MVTSGGRRLLPHPGACALSTALAAGAATNLNGGEAKVAQSMIEAAVEEGKAAAEAVSAAAGTVGSSSMASSEPCVK